MSKSGNVVVCHKDDQYRHTISVFNNKGEKNPSFNSGGERFHMHVAFTADDNHILAVSNHQIVKYTMEGKSLISVECTKHRLYYPSGIAVHPSGKVILVGSCIQVLNPDLTYSHSFVHGGSPHMACGSDGLVYVVGNYYIRSFNIDGQCINKHSYDFTEVTSINGFCIDSTNTMYVSNTSLVNVLRKCVSVYSNSGKFIKCISLDNSVSLAGIAVDNTTGVLYVCDDMNDCVIVY